jgi:hypothetical protein
MVKRTKEVVSENVTIMQIEAVTLKARIKFTSPLIMNRMAAKVRQQLLLPRLSQNRAALEQKLKHNPIEEYRDSIYRCREDDAPTLVHLPTGCFKQAIASAAIDIPGARKAQIGRLVSIGNPTVHLYGIPQLYMTPVRMADFSKTPDIRTRAIFPKAVCEIEIKYIRKLIREHDLLNLLAAAGMIIGVGDGRTEKGTFDYGQFELVLGDDAEYKQIMKDGRRVAQLHAVEHPEFYDLDTEELFAWYQAEVRQREASISQPEPLASARKRSRTNAAAQPAAT